MFRDSMHGISVGGDFENRDDAIDNIAVTQDGGVTWTLVRDPNGQPSALSGNRTAVKVSDDAVRSSLQERRPIGSRPYIHAG